MISPASPATALEELRSARRRSLALACSARYPETAARDMDRYFSRRLAEAGPLHTPAALVAVGGYGRCELSLASDVDVLLVYAGEIPEEAEELAARLFHPLWDEKIKLGHGVRSVADCASLAARDPKVFASLLDARLAAGEASVAAALWKALRPDSLQREAPGWSPLEFARWLEQEHADRAARYGELDLLAPDIKSGPGGLRDLHHVRWLALALHGQPCWPGIFPEADQAGLRAAGELLLRCRSALHMAGVRNGDAMPLELQPEIARRLGFEDKDPARRAETFLAELHQAMALIRRARRAVSRLALHGDEPPVLLGGGLVLEAGGLALQDVDHDGASPGSLLEVFETQARLGADLSWAAREAIRRRARAEADGLLKLPDLAERLADLLSGPNAEQAGRGMLDAGLLGAVIPELEARRGLVQFDDFHIHPLGEHTIKTVARLADLLQGSDPRFERWVRRAARPRPLILAGLLHDVGKGDGDHARRGAAMAEAILGRLGADERTVQDVRFLVANHLLLFEASRTMDLGDETALGRLAMEVRSSERLAMLVLLSAADAQATGPRAWDGWIASLLLELADKLANLLTRGPLAEPYAAPTILAKRDRVRSLARGVLAPDFVESALDVLDPRYALANEPEAMVKDLDLMRQLERELEQDRTRRPHGRGGLGVCAIRAEPAEAPQTFHVAAAALDQPGLFAAMAGVFALLSVDVLDASIHTFGRGLALDRFTVSAASSRLEAGDLFERVRQSIRSALSGRLSLAYRIHEKRASPLAPALGGPPVEPQVCIDNETSDFFTVVEVRARDRLGLLFDLARTLADLRLAVHQARITTRADAVADVFFVRDELGEKILEPDRIRELTRALLHAARD